MQQIRVGNAVMPGRRRKFLALRDFWIGVRFDEIGNAVDGETKVDAGIAIEFQRSVDPLGYSLDAGV